jgi:integrase
MTPEQVLQFWAAAGQTRFKMLFTLAYNIGCRPGELLGLKWEFVDVASMTIKIRKTIRWRKGKKKGELEWYLDTPKTEKGLRDLPLTESLVELLASHRKVQLEERMKAGRAWREQGFVFPDEIGEPYSQNRLLYFCKKILKLAGLPEHFTSYSARHTSATLAIECGIDPKTVADRLGHTDVRITLKTYTHPTAGMQTEASRVIEQALNRRK